MTSSTRADTYARVTSSIVAAIEAGAGSWTMPWHHSGSDVTRPMNAVSRKPYRGINTVSLWAAAYLRNYSSGVWATFNQWQALGATVRKGARATPAVLWKEYSTRDAADDAAGDAEADSRRRLFARSFSLFNAEQVDGYVGETRRSQLSESERLANADRFIDQLGIETVFGAASAYYRIDEDCIHMPDFSGFREARMASMRPTFTNARMRRAPSSGSIAALPANGPSHSWPWRK